MIQFVMFRNVVTYLSFLFFYNCHIVDLCKLLEFSKIKNTCVGKINQNHVPIHTPRCTTIQTLLNKVYIVKQAKSFINTFCQQLWSNKDGAKLPNPTLLNDYIKAKYSHAYYFLYSMSCF